MVIVSLRNFFYNTYIYISDDFLVFISGWNNKQAVVSISQINKKRGYDLRIILFSGRFMIYREEGSLHRLD